MLWTERYVDWPVNRFTKLVKLFLVKRDVICLEHSLHQLTCRCNCHQGSQAIDCTAGQVSGSLLQVNQSVLTTTFKSSSSSSSAKSRTASVSDFIVNRSFDRQNRGDSSLMADRWTCVVCCQQVPGQFRHEVYAIGPCDHPVCYMCSIKMRVLCEQHDCPICRQDMLKVVFTSSRDVKFANIDWSKLKPITNEYLIYFDSTESQDLFNALLLHSCKICKTSETMFPTLKELDVHLRKVHEVFLCDLCVEHLRILSHERKYYTRKELSGHRKYGDPDDKSHRGHPLCQFCDVRYLDDEDLHRHLRKDHYYCHFCDPMGLNMFYDEYKHLRVHFKEAHYLCEDGGCKEEKFTSVFATEIDLQAHRLSFHRTGKESKDARVLSLDFSLRPRHSNVPSGSAGATSANYLPQISASVHHTSSRALRAAGITNSDGTIAGAVGGYDEHDEEAAIAAAINASIQQELPRPEDFPTLAGEAVASQQAQIKQTKQNDDNDTGENSTESNTSTSSKSQGKKGKSQEPGSYGSIAKEFKDFTPKSLPPNKKATFSSRTGTAGSFVKTDDDFPSLPVNVAPSKHKKAYTALKSSVSAAAGSVPRVVSKVANATCLPSSYSSAASNVASSYLMQVSSCLTSDASNSKSQSTQSLISNGKSMDTGSPSPFTIGASGSNGNKVKNYSVKSVEDFPSLPMAPPKKKNQSTSNSSASKKVTSCSSVADVVTGTCKKKKASKTASNSNSTCTIEENRIHSSTTSSNNSSSNAKNKKQQQQAHMCTLVGIANAAFSASSESFTKPTTDSLSSSLLTINGTKSKKNTHKNSSESSDLTTSATKQVTSTSESLTSGKKTVARVNENTASLSNVTAKKNHLDGIKDSSASHTHNKTNAKKSETASLDCKSKPSEKTKHKQQQQQNNSLALDSSNNREHSKIDATAINSSVTNSLLTSCSFPSLASNSDMNHKSIPNTTAGESRNDKNTKKASSLASGSKSSAAPIIDNSADNHVSYGHEVTSSSSSHGNSKKDVKFDEATIIQQFNPPCNFESRNLTLVEQVSNLLKDQQKFSAFKRVSNDFRKDEMKGDEYYKKCIDLFGRNNLDKIFIDLITLLPNIKKQNELLSAHEKSLRLAKGSAGCKNVFASAPNLLGRNCSSTSGSSTPQSGVWVLNASAESSSNSNILVCPKCQQVLAKKDGPEHISHHSTSSTSTTTS